VVVTHGLKDNSGRYEAFATRLTAQGFAVYAWDLRGHGHSGGRRVWVERFDDYVADLGRFVELASAREHTEKVFVFGHSMGGAITTLYAVAHPEHVAGVILSAAALVSNANPLEESGARVFDVIAPETGVFQLAADDFSRDPAVVAAMKADPLVYQPGAPAHTAVELVDALDRIDASMETLKVPVLAMHGTADVVTDPEGSKALARRAGTQDKTLKVYDGLVHDLLHEPEHPRVEADILAWLESHAKP
jgi:alpha-beta hydrolase superfamily lysophospholipase